MSIAVMAGCYAFTTFWTASWLFYRKEYGYATAHFDAPSDIATFIGLWLGAPFILPVTLLRNYVRWLHVRARAQKAIDTKSAGVS